jgi:hypothetical protein
MGGIGSKKVSFINDTHPEGPLVVELIPTLLLQRTLMSRCDLLSSMLPVVVIQLITEYVHQSMILACGGTAHGSGKSNRVWALDLFSYQPQWYSLPSMRRARLAHIACVIDDKILVVGGKH